MRLFCLGGALTLLSCGGGGGQAPDAAPADAGSDWAVPVDDAGVVPPTIHISAGLFFTCEWQSGVSAACWGYNAYGMLGAPTTDTFSVSPVTVSNLVPIGLSVGGYAACAIAPDRRVWCWGDDFSGELGQPGLTESSIPVLVPGVTDAVQVAMEGSFACALRADGTVWCWGDNNAGELGNGALGGTNFGVMTASEVVGLHDVTSVTVGGGHACALVADGTVRCWGNNTSGQLGNGTADTSCTCGGEPTPVVVAGVSGVRAIAAGMFHTCALIADGTVMCWGDNAYGEIGSGTIAVSPTPYAVTTPTQVVGLSGVVSISAGASATCATLADHTARCWGRNELGMLGNGTKTDTATPTAVTGLANVRATTLSSNGTHACAELLDGTHACWGDNQQGELGDGTTTSSLVPVLVP